MWLGSYKSSVVHWYSVKKTVRKKGASDSLVIAKLEATQKDILEKQFLPSNGDFHQEQFKEGLREQCFSETSFGE